MELPSFSTPPVIIRPAATRERVALRVARWPRLAEWAWSAADLHVAVAGRREALLGCGWKIATETGAEAGLAVVPGGRLAGEATEGLLTAICSSGGAVKWTEWLDCQDRLAAALQARGFRISRRMMGYEIIDHPEGHQRLERGLRGAGARMKEAGLSWGCLDEKAVPEVRRATAEAGLMGARQFDFYYRAGAFDLKSSPVAWLDGALAGFSVVMAGPAFEVALIYIRESLRATGLNALLLGEVIQRANAARPGWERIVFRGDLDASPRTRRMCQRFGGRESAACIKLVLDSPA